MERRVKRKFHARCGTGENPEITSKDYLSSLYKKSNIDEYIEYYKGPAYALNYLSPIQ